MFGSRKTERSAIFQQLPNHIKMGNPRTFLNPSPNGCKMELPSEKSESPSSATWKGLADLMLIHHRFPVFFNCNQREEWIQILFNSGRSIRSSKFNMHQKTQIDSFFSLTFDFKLCKNSVSHPAVIKITKIFTWWFPCVLNGYSSKRNELKFIKQLSTF